MIPYAPVLRIRADGGAPGTMGINLYRSRPYRPREGDVSQDGPTLLTPAGGQCATALRWPEYPGLRPAHYARGQRLQLGDGIDVPGQELPQLCGKLIRHGQHWFE
jgi:hypothetical protein